MSRKLSLEDILDLRAYESQREEYIARIIELKRKRRISVGPYITFVFENRETMRFQVQEMARAEKMLRDEQVQGELDAYNPLIPEPGELSATLLVELRSNEELREWLPRLVGVERSVAIRVGDETIPVDVDPTHAEMLTREDVTSSVHYVRFRFDEAQIEAFARQPAVLVIDHPNYRHETPLPAETRATLLEDLRPDA